jgi:AcrR family transcriptional regulator
MTQAGRRSRLSTLYDGFLRKRPRQSRSRALVDAVLEAATELLARSRGELSMQEVARRAGVGIGSLYDYFADRPSILAAVIAKVTEDNSRLFERQLAEHRDAPLSAALSVMTRHVLTHYLDEPRLPRAVLRAAYTLGMMPTLAQSIREFSATMAAALRARNDVECSDYEQTAWMMTTMAMGTVHALLWSDPPPFSRDAIEGEIVEIWRRHLATPQLRSSCG